MAATNIICNKFNQILVVAGNVSHLHWA